MTTEPEFESDHIILPRDQPVGQLAPQPWMEAPETRYLFSALSADGTEPRFAGGCVRDALLHRPIHDIDIATPDRPEKVMELLDRAGIRAIPTGIAHGTVTAVIGKTHFEITTLRIDVETDGRHARVAFTDDWIADAMRRDFTINALYCLQDGRIIDPCEGLFDLGVGRVRFIGEPRMRIAEDGLRILRFFRFHAHYGSPPPDAAALAACRVHAEMLDKISGERIRAEFFRILEAPAPEAVLLLMEADRVLQRILPHDAHDFGRLRLLAFLETRGIIRPDIAPDTLRRLAALFPPDERLALAAAERLRLSRRDRDRLRVMVAPRFLPNPETDHAELEAQLDRIGPELFRDLVLLSWAARMAINGTTGGTAGWVALLDLAVAWQPRIMPVTGDDVVAAGIPPGPRVGMLLDELAEWWREHRHAPERDEILAHLIALVASGFGRDFDPGDKSGPGEDPEDKDQEKEQE